MNSMMQKLMQMQQKVEETKTKLETISVEGEAANGKLKVLINGNRIVKSVNISPDLKDADLEELEDYLVIAINNAIEQANRINETEMQSAASGLIPGM